MGTVPLPSIPDFLRVIFTRDANYHCPLIESRVLFENRQHGIKLKSMPHVFAQNVFWQRIPFAPEAGGSPARLKIKCDASSLQSSTIFSHPTGGRDRGSGRGWRKGAWNRNLSHPPAGIFALRRGGAPTRWRAGALIYLALGGGGQGGRQFDAVWCPVVSNLHLPRVLV